MSAATKPEAPKLTSQLPRISHRSRGVRKVPTRKKGFWDSDILTLATQFAAEIEESSGVRPTLRQLFYRLVSAQVLRNTASEYSALAQRSAQARRDGDFPELIDRGRSVHRLAAWASSRDAMGDLIGGYHRDRTAGQDFGLYLGVEKAGMISQLEYWFTHLGIPILGLAGYSSQSFVNVVAGEVDKSGRPAILLYAGDFDASGVDIDRDFTERAGCFDKVIRVALNPEQIEQYQLPPLPGKHTDPRAAGFVRAHGTLMQVELDALPPAVLRDLYQAEIDQFVDMEMIDSILAKEEKDKRKLRAARRLLRTKSSFDRRVKNARDRASRHE